MRVKGLIVFLMVTIVLSSCSNVKKTNSLKAIDVSVLIVSGTNESTTKTYVGTVEESYGFYYHVFNNLLFSIKEITPYFNSREGFLLCR